MPSFDFTAYKRAQHAARAAASIRWGWPERNYGLQDVTEYYHFHRELIFRRGIAVLREHAVDGLNALFVRLKINARVELSGLQSPGVFEDLLSRLSIGSATFEDILKIDRQELSSDE
jgi:hypothetical protein